MSAQKLLMIQGIPGSGKSYLAKKLLKEDQTHKTVIVNRDNIRSMLGDYWVPSREDLVTKIELEMITTSLMEGYTVIVDATNLNPKTIKSLKNISRRTKTAIEYAPILVSARKAFLRICWRRLMGGRFISFSIVENFYNRYKDIIGV